MILRFKIKEARDNLHQRSNIPQAYENRFKFDSMLEF